MMGAMPSLVVSMGKRNARFILSAGSSLKEVSLDRSAGTLLNFLPSVFWLVGFGLFWWCGERVCVSVVQLD